MTIREEKKLNTFMRFAHDLANLSTCKRARVGAIIVPRDFTEVLAIGYNGPPTGQPNDSCTSEKGDCGCVHAEANAIVKLRVRHSLEGLLLLSTTAPCHRCAALIVNSKMIGVVKYYAPYRDDRGEKLLQRAGIVVVGQHDSRS